MTSFKDNKVRSSLVKKGFILSETHHKYYYFYDRNGKRTKVRTYLSHDGQDINDYLIGNMAKQVKLTKTQFINLINCPLSRDQYEEILKEQDAL